MKKEAIVTVKDGKIAFCKLENEPCFLCAKAEGTRDRVECEIKTEFEKNKNK